MEDLPEQRQTLPKVDLRDHPMSYDCINDLSQCLNIERPLGNDWHFLAVHLGFDEHNIIQSLEGKENPTRCVLQIYVTMKELPTWQGVQKALRDMERADAEDILLLHAVKAQLTQKTPEDLPSDWHSPANLNNSLRQTFGNNMTLVKGVSDKLDHPHPLGRDWKLLAGKLGYHDSEISKFENNKTPAFAVIQAYMCKRDTTLGSFYHALKEIERYDVIYFLFKEQVFTEQPHGNNEIPVLHSLQYSAKLDPSGRQSPALRQMSLQPEVQRAEGKDDMGDLKPRNHGQAKPHYDVSKHRQSYPNTEIQNEDKKQREMGNMDEITNRLPESLRLSNQQPIDSQGIGDTREIQPAANMHHKVGPGGDGTTDPGLSQSGERKVKIDPKNMTHEDTSADGQTREGVEYTHAQDNSEILSDDTGSQPVSSQSGVSTPYDYPERVQPPTQQTQNTTQPGQDMDVSTYDQPIPSDIDASSNNQSVSSEEGSSSDAVDALGDDDDGSTDKLEEQKILESSNRKTDTAGSSSTPSFHKASRLYFLKYSHIEKITNNFTTFISKEGAFGYVYEGIFPYDGPLKGRKVAVKVLNPEGEHGVKEYDREKSVAAVKHPNILPVFAVCDEGDKKCVLYPYMENKDLALQINEKNKQLTWEKRLAIAIGLCRAVTYLHSPTELRKMKVYHRDIKSANVLLSGSWWPYLGDTGLTRETAMKKTHLSQTGSQLGVSGTPGYQDPALFEKPPGYYDDYCDIYSLGKVLLELLTNVLAQEMDDENQDYMHNKWKADKVFKNPELLSSIAVESSVGWPQLEENEVAKQFAKVVILCLRTARKKKVKLQNICEQLEELAGEADIHLFKSDDRNENCIMCLTECKAGQSLPLGCECNVVCTVCMKNHRKNSLMCPTHGMTRPIIGTNTYLVAVGVSGDVYKNDAKEIHRLFTDPNIGAIEEQNAYLLLGKDATRGDITETLEDIAKLSKEHGMLSLVIFYYSGHNRGGAYGSLRCHGGDQLREIQLSKLLDEIKSERKLLILDCCFAENMYPKKYLYKGDNDDATEDIGDAEAQADESISQYCMSIKLGRGFRMWAAGERNEEAAGANEMNTDQKHSVFTKYIIAGLEGAKTCEFGKNCRHCETYRSSLESKKCVLFTEIADFVYRHVDKQLYSKQNPKTMGSCELDYMLAYAACNLESD